MQMAFANKNAMPTPIYKFNIDISAAFMPCDYIFFSPYFLVKFNQFKAPFYALFRFLS